MNSSFKSMFFVIGVASSLFNLCHNINGPQLELKEENFGGMTANQTFLCFQGERNNKLSWCKNANKTNLACFDESKGEVKMCQGTRFHPVCFKVTKFHKIVLTACLDKSMHLCSSATTSHTFDYCKDAKKAACLNEEGTIQHCVESRPKRQGSKEFPRLDTDAYYASCENCSINIIMEVNDENDETPKIVIKSNPLKPGESLQ